MAEAIEESVARAGRTVVFAGTALAVGMLGALIIAPGLAAGVRDAGRDRGLRAGRGRGLFAIPAGLAVLGDEVDRWQLWAARGENPWVRLSERMSRKPPARCCSRPPAAAATAPALALDTGPPNVQNLPPDNAARKSFEAFQRDRGAGWATPFEVDFQTQGPITTEARLRALKRFQQQVARQPGVEAVLGPASLLERTEVLRSLTRQIVTGGRSSTGWREASRRLLFATGRLSAAWSRGRAGANALANGLGQAAGGLGPDRAGHRQGGPQTQRWPTASRARAGGQPLAKRSRRRKQGRASGCRTRSTSSRASSDKQNDNDFGASSSTR